MGAYPGAFILVVEDDPEARASLVTLLACRGYACSGVRSAKEAKRVIEKIVPDVMILDLVLPDLRGDVLLKHVRGSSEPKVLALPVVVVSGLEGAKEVAPGADAYFGKPLDVVPFIAKVDALVRRSRDPKPVFAAES